MANSPYPRPIPSPSDPPSAAPIPSPPAGNTTLHPETGQSDFTPGGYYHSSVRDQLKAYGFDEATIRSYEKLHRPASDALADAKTKQNENQMGLLGIQQNEPQDVLVHNVHQPDFGMLSGHPDKKQYSSIVDVMRAPFDFAPHGAQILNLQNRLVSAGILTPADVTGIYDSKTMEAYHVIINSAQGYGMTPDEMLAQYAGVNSKKLKLKAPFVAPARTRVNEKDIQSVATATAKQLIGEEAGPGDIAKITATVRSQEDQEYAGVYQQALDQHNAQMALASQQAGLSPMTDQGAPPPAQTGGETVNQAASPSSTAEDYFLHSPEAAKWAMISGIAALQKIL